MPRSRSRSPKRPERRRSRSRERRRRPRRSRSRSPPPRYRSRSPTRRRPHSRSPQRRSPSPRRRSKEREVGRSSQVEKRPPPVEKPKFDESQLAALSEEDREMAQLMGFASFDSTKGKKVEGNDLYSADIVRKRRYRQYMNRRGGFNRPLDFIA